MKYNIGEYCPSGRGEVDENIGRGKCETGENIVRVGKLTEKRIICSGCHLCDYIDKPIDKKPS